MSQGGAARDRGGGPEGAPSGCPDGETLDHARGLLAETREELTRAEGKSAVLLAAIGVAVGALLAALMEGKWAPFDLRNGLEWAWWLGAACLAASAACLAAAVWPKTGSDGSDDRAPAFFGDFTRFRTPEALGDALRSRGRSEAYARTTEQLVAVGRIVRRKYRLVKWAVALVGAAAVLCLGTAILDAVLP